jgi:diguanylate cyclase (GGDEF)-like protein
VLAKDLASAHAAVYAPSLFAERIGPLPDEEEAAASIHKLMQSFLWPMARDGIVHNIMNRVRLTQNAPVLPYRILICPLQPALPTLGYVAAFRTLHQDPYIPSDLRALTGAVPGLLKRLNDRRDDTTGLLMRPAFEAEVAYRGRGTGSACVVYANLDQVHAVNELSGFAAGDRIIREVGRYWQSRLAPTGSIATHLSGDRFAAVLFGHTLNQARIWADQTREGIDQLNTNRADAHVTASFGVAELTEVEAFQHTLAAAETACRVAKERGRNRVELYVTGDHTVMRRHEEVRESREVLEALENNSFILYAQPILTFDSEAAPRHYEILLRVQRPDGEVVSIAGFLDAAERYQLLERLDRWVLARVLGMLSPVAEALAPLGASFAMNLTGQSVSQPAFADHVRSEMKTHGIPSGMLHFELTETAALRNLSATQRFIARMGEIGSHVALDDFGTGLSSLMHLKDLDVNRIKIDGKFVRDVLSNARSRALIRALVQIADEIGLQTVAEFVENEDISDSVRLLGVQCGQGYFYGRPRPLSEALQDLLIFERAQTAQNTASSSLTTASHSLITAARA